MDLDPSVVWDFAGTLVGTLRERPRQLPATVSRVDPDGTVWLSMPGADGLVPASTTADVGADDAVTVEWWGNAYHVTGNRTSPSVGTRAAAALRRATAAAAKVAGEAKGIADAVGQHFWADDNGVHVSNEDGNATGERNILMNSLGILLRQGSAWLASFSDSAVAFYDGLGNEAANIVAQFGADGATIGRATAGRLVLSSDGLAQFTDDGVMGIMAGLSSTNHTLDVTHPEQKLRIGEAYWYKMYDRAEYKRSSPSAEWPFLASTPTTGVSKFLLTLRLDGFQDGVIVGNVTYDIAVPFASDYAFNVPGTTFYVRWNATNQALLVEKMTPDQQDSHGVYSTLRVTYTGYVTVESAKSPVLLFGEHTGASAPGLYAVALGRESTSEGDNALTAGIATSAASEAQTAIGKYNDNDADNAFEVGNGTADGARSNAFAVGWDGTVTTARDTDTTTVADVLTAAQGVTIGAVSYIQRGGVAALFIRASRSAATSGATTIGTLVTGKRPVMETAAPAPSGSGDVYVAADGTVTYRPSGTVAAGSNLYVRITYLVA